MNGVINPRRPLIVVKRKFYDAFADGSKTIEYRRHHRPFTRSTFFPGREVRIVCNYDLSRAPPALIARVIGFDAVEARALRSMREYASLLEAYRDLKPDDEIACVALKLI